jgi:antibiotic biosynthesis monooxygenase (ABM) superfamily enzyme
MGIGIIWVGEGLVHNIPPAQENVPSAGRGGRRRLPGCRALLSADGGGLLDKYGAYKMSLMVNFGLYFNPFGQVYSIEPNRKNLFFVINCLLDSQCPLPLITFAILLTN